MLAAAARKGAATLKIAVSGAVSTGKTTLGRALAERLDLPFIEENLDSMFAAPAGQRKSPQAFARALVQCLERKRWLEAEAGRFVVDRCPLDLLNFWQARRLPRQVAGHDIYELCRRSTADYDFVVLTPWSGIPLGRDSPDRTGRARTRDPWVQFKGSCMIAGLARHFIEPRRIVQIPNELMDGEKRLEFVLAAVGAGRDQAP